MHINQRFVFSGHAIGASAHFHRLDDVHNLDIEVPTIGSSVVPQNGGVSKHEITGFEHPVDTPRKRTLLKADYAHTIARGRHHANHHETEVSIAVKGVSFVEKLHIDRVELRQTATRPIGGRASQILTTAAGIQGLRLGNVKAAVHLDNSLFERFGSKKEIIDFLNDPKNAAYREANAWRFAEINNRFYATLVTRIDLSGPEEELKAMSVHENTIRWHGFGKIYLGEVNIRDEDRRVTMVRLKMGSDAGGDGTIGDGHTNGGTVP